MRARYLAERHEIAARYKEWEIAGPPEIRGDPNDSLGYFRPIRTKQSIPNRPLMSWAETWAREHGYREIAVDTAEPAQHLVAFYSRRGYRFIAYAQWPGKRYRSVILSKEVAVAP